MCGDPGCDEFTCLSTAPSGWTGPFALYDGASPPPCSAPASNEVLLAYSNLANEPAVCTGCTCGGGTNPSCGATASVAFQSVCPNTFNGVGSGLTANTVVSGCTNNPGVTSPVTAVYLGPSSLSYSCQAPSVKTTLPPPKWGHTLRGCAVPFPQNKGCGAGAACQPLPKAPFENRLCVAQDGDVACPAATFVTKRLAHKDVTEGRTCSACKCTAAGGTCQFDLTLYDQANCGGASQKVTVDSTEACLPGFKAVSSGNVSGQTFPGTMACNASGGTPGGSLAPAKPVTICCTP